MEFDLGEISLSPTVKRLMVYYPGFSEFYEECMDRYTSCDWGDVDDFEKHRNNKAVRCGGEIYASYDFPDELDVDLFIMNKVLVVFTDEYRLETSVTLSADFECAWVPEQFLDDDE